MTDELIASVDATMAEWNAAVNTPDPQIKQADGVGAAREMCLSPDAYQSRLRTFQPATYFAKPLALSPLMCAAFGWTNPGEDILKCANPKCNEVLPILFLESFDKESIDVICQKYLKQLASKHSSGENECPFRSYSSRWLKSMHRYSAIDAETREDNADRQLFGRAVTHAKPKFYVPPFFLSLSNEFKRFEDCSADGSVTRDIVTKSAREIQDTLQTIFGEDSHSCVDVLAPDEMTTFCRDVLSPCAVNTIFDEMEKTQKVSYLLAMFGWSISSGDKSIGEEEGAVVMKCNICLARSLLAATNSEHSTGSTPQKKKRRIDTQNSGINLIESHRVYCPHVSGFAYNAEHESHLPGWKVVVANLLRSLPESNRVRAIMKH